VDFEEILTRLADASDEELSAALREIGTQAASFTGPANAETAGQLKKLANAATAIKSQQDERARVAQEYQTNLELLGQLTAQPEPPAEQPPAEQPPAPEAPPAVEPPAEQPKTEEPPPAETEQQPEGGDTVTASARRPLGGAGLTTSRTPGFQSLELATKVTGQAGLVLPSDPEEARERLAEAFATKASERNVYSKTTLLNANWLHGYEQAGRFVSRKLGAFKNSRTFTQVEQDVRSRSAAENALTAAGLCAPVTPVYDIPVVGVTNRPVRDALAPIGADRGGITYRPAIDGVLQTGGMGNWTAANDEADPLVPKTCFEVECPDPVEAEVEAIYHCLTFSNMSTRFDPEAMDAAIQAGDIAFARFAENKLIAQLVNGSKTMYAPKVLGASRDVFASLDKFLAYYRNVHRLDDNQPLRHIVPLWLKDLMRVDIVRQMVGDGVDVTMGVADAMITDWFQRRNVNVTYHLDGIDPADITVTDPDIVIPNQAYTLAAANTEVPGFKDVVSTLLFREGDWKYLDGGELNLGMVRDSTLNAQNRFQLFREEFGNPAHRGIESVHFVYQLQPNGTSAATVSTTGVVD
jgi:hypothetical protein